MKISNHITATYGVDIQKAAGNKPAEKADKVRKSDSVAVSKEAAKISQSTAEIETTKTRITALPEVRLDRVEAVKDKISAGFYNTEKFRSELADRLIKTFSNPIA